MHLVPLPDEDVGECKVILLKMQCDEISMHVKSDKLICKYGNMLYIKHGHDNTQHAYIAQKMRELGRLVMAVGQLDSSVKTLQDLIVPSRFRLVIDGVKKVSGFNAGKNKFATPSLALKIGYSLKKCAEIAVGEALMGEDKETEERAKSFIKLHDAQWRSYISSHALSSLHQNKWNKPDVIPLTEDVCKLQKFLQKTEENAKQELEKNPSPSAWRSLCETLLAEVILFNRRREGEAAKMLLEVYETRSTAPVNADVYNSLTKLEQTLCDKLTRIEIRGKRGRKTREDVGVPQANPYVFARVEALSHIRGSDCLRKFSHISGAKHPEYLTSTKLRKHVGTLCQIMNLKENELEQVARFMGHDIRVHRDFYRLQENTLQLAKMSKLLLVMEKDAATYKGKSLDEINLSAEERRKVTKRPWTNEEQAAVKKHLSKFISVMRVPGKSECDACIQAEPALSHRTWKDVKNFVYNQIQSIKKGRGTPLFGTTAVKGKTRISVSTEKIISQKRKDS
ncbi:hypothetical protein Z043_118102, partial [Scleropages formosus]